MRLSDREKLAVGIGSAVLGVLVFWLAVWEPAHAHLELQERRVQAKREEYREIRELGDRFQRLSARIEGIEAHLRRSRDFSILSYLEGLARRHQVQDRIVQMRPRPGEVSRYYRENSVEIRMERVRLSELVRYLYEVEHSPELLRVKQIQVRPRFDDADLLDVRFQVSSYEPLEGA
ncbi:MAG: type II secretion system protein GspM [Deferrisomatales bacterium]|nr:type II secretion system protein GspM [Deferrisomatales bacterium]